ncbi:MAG TPA: hypothetical protein VGH73_11535 [Thermoanaerobaculia bacterium]|jgi:hypothetical protein
MKTSATVLVLLALLALVPCVPCAAQTPSAAPVTSVPSTADFLATLSGGQSQTPAGLTPAPSFMAGCTSNAQCLPGQRCCPACGQPDCGMACFVVVKGGCPPFV